MSEGSDLYSTASQSVQYYILLGLVGGVLFHFCQKYPSFKGVCQCPRGTVELGDRCVEPEDCPSASQCQHPIVSGLCLAYFPSWGYNTTSGQCEKFIYGGCGGNENRFCSQEECEYVCGE